MTSPPAQTGKEMSESGVESFLASNDTGVLSLGIENRGYGFPISYTHDEENDRLILGFVASPESKKQEFASATEEATFTIYTYEDVDSWKSVIATGTIRPLEESDTTHRVPDLFFRQGTDDATEEGPMIDLDEFERTWFELRIETLSGRHSGR